MGGGRPGFPTLALAQTRAEQARVQKDNEGTAAFALPIAVKLDAFKANQILAPHDVSIIEAAKYYDKHVLAYKSAPPVKDIVERYIADTISRNKRPATVKDLRQRLNTFAETFGDVRLSEVTLDELKEWIDNDEWDARSRINYLTKLSQLYGFSRRHQWVDSNLTELIARPTADETIVRIFPVPQAEQLLIRAQEFEALPYIAIGLFAGIRAAELARLSGRNVNFAEKTITITGQVAKKRSQRIVDMQPALLAWLAPCREELEAGAPVVTDKYRKRKPFLLEAAGIQDWPANGLRHSFGSYHLAMFRSADETAHQMGNSADMVHRHYKALVTKAEAEKFWNLRPQAATGQPSAAVEERLEACLI